MGLQEKIAELEAERRKHPQHSREYNRLTSSIFYNRHKYELACKRARGGTRMARNDTSGAVPMYVSISEDEYRYMEWCKTMVERLHPVHVANWKRENGYGR